LYGAGRFLDALAFSVVEITGDGGGACVGGALAGGATHLNGAVFPIVDEKYELLCGFDKKHAVKRDEIAVGANEMKVVAPRLIKAHTHRRQRIGRIELSRPHGVAGFRLQNTLTVKFAAIQQSHCETAMSPAVEEIPPAGAGTKISNPIAGFSVVER